MTEDLSKVEVLAEAIRGLSDPEMVRLRQLVQGLRRDRVDAIFDAICSMKVEDVARLQAMMNMMLTTPPPQAPGHEGGVREPVVPKDPRLSGPKAEFKPDEKAMQEYHERGYGHTPRPDWG